MKLFLRCFPIFLLFLTAMGQLQGTAQGADTAKQSGLLVYGDGFMFSVSEPAGWTGDYDNAKSYYADLLFYKNKNDLKNGGAFIQVSNFRKEDEHTEKDLEYDIKGYKEKFNKLVLQELKTSHKTYKCYGKLMYVENSFYQYTVYLNPGPVFKTGVSVAMNISKKTATEDELKAFREIIASLVMLKG